jgi:hypothetical protein
MKGRLDVFLYGLLKKHWILSVILGLFLVVFIVVPFIYGWTGGYKRDRKEVENKKVELFPAVSHSNEGVTIPPEVKKAISHNATVMRVNKKLKESGTGYKITLEYEHSDPSWEYAKHTVYLIFQHDCWNSISDKKLVVDHISSFFQRSFDDNTSEINVRVIVE